MASKPVEGSEPRVGLWSGSVSVSCPRGRTLPQYRRTRRHGWAQKKLALAKTNIVSYGVVQKMFMPSPEFHARKMRNEKGGLGSNTHQCIVLPNFPLSFAFIILTVVPTLRFPCCVDIIVNQICFGALSSR